MKFAALYVRTSTDQQTGGAESQLRALRNWAESRGLERIQVYEDIGHSGAKANRPALDSLMADCREGKIALVACHAFSRFARSTSHLLSALEEFNRLDVGFTSISEQVDTSTPMGRTLFTILAAIGELERNLIQERVKAGLLNAAAKGRFPGRPAKRNSTLIHELHSKGYRHEQIARLAGTSIATVSRELSGYFQKPRMVKYG